MDNTIRNKILSFQYNFNNEDIVDYWKLCLILKEILIDNELQFSDDIYFYLSETINNILNKIFFSSNFKISEKSLNEYNKQEFKVEDVAQYQILLIRILEYLKQNFDIDIKLDKNFIQSIYNQLNLQYNLDNIEETTSKKYAWFTFVSKPLYLEGAKNLYLRMKYLKSKYPVIILITGNEITQEDLKVLEDIPYITAPLVQFNNHKGRFIDTLMKFYCFELIDYDRICYLDSDILPLINIDDWFDLYNLGHDYDGFKTIRYNDNNEMFLTSEGCLFFITPKKNKFQEIINLSEILNFSNDEEISFYLYGAHLNYLNISSLFNTSINHFGVFPKYWQLQEYNSNLINYSSKQLTDYLLNLQDIRATIIINNNYKQLEQNYGYKY